MKKDYFAHKASRYELDHTIDNVGNIARCIVEAVPLSPSMKIMDFGSGTGLLLEKIATKVGHIVAVDVSSAMNRQLEAKREKLGCELEIIETDLSKSPLDRKFDGVISSMTLHHVENTRSMFESFYSMLVNGGFIAVADLDAEDGSFHTEDTGVFHHGFDRQQLIDMARDCGFRQVEIRTASVVHKPHGDYPVFLLTAYR